MKRLTAIAACLGVTLLARAAEKEHRLGHTVVAYEGIGKDYAEAIARTVEAARAAAVEKLGVNMPDAIHVSARSNPKRSNELFNDGQDRFSLTVRSERDLLKPSQSGAFHIYGLCHEVGHLAMYRPIRDHAWLSTAGAEGWAHYLGSRLVDEVHAREGEKLWPDPYNYKDDGTARLKRQLEGGSRSPIANGAALWMELAEIVGDKGLAPIFDAWGKAEVDPADPGAAIGKALLAAKADPKLPEWWKKAEAVLTVKRSKSDFAARTVAPKALSGRPTELAHDDGAPAGKRSFAGGGHAVRFQVEGDAWYLTAVSIHGARYGALPKEDFHVWLCDADLKPIADFPFPYSSFAAGPPKWATLEVKPTSVPPEFVVCVAFNPTATKGVFVSHDKEPSGNSLAGLPGFAGQAFPAGDWLIRAKVGRLKSANPLTPGK